MTGVIIEKADSSSPSISNYSREAMWQILFWEEKTVQFDMWNKSFLANYTIRVFTTLKGGIFRTAKSMFRRFTAVKHENTDEAAR